MGSYWSILPSPLASQVAKLRIPLARSATKGLESSSVPESTLWLKSRSKTRKASLALTQAVFFLKPSEPAMPSQLKLIWEAVNGVVLMRPSPSTSRATGMKRPTRLVLASLLLGLAAA